MAGDRGPFSWSVNASNNWYEGSGEVQSVPMTLNGRPVPRLDRIFSIQSTLGGWRSRLIHV
jgi:hypothetical protein